MVTYFSHLPDDVLYIILQELSASPRSKYWISHITERSLRLIIDKKGPFRNITRKIFHKLDINGTPRPGHLRVSGRLAGSFRALRLMKNCCEEVMISDTISDRVPRVVYDDLVKNLKCLLSLDLRLDNESVGGVPFVSIIKKHSSTLKSINLTFRGRADIPSESNIYFLPRIESLRISSRGLERFTDLLKSCGPTCKGVSLRGDPDTKWMKVMPVLENYWFKVQDISLYGRDVPLNRYAQLLKSYGKQLRKVKLDRMSPETCCEIVRRCPNVITDMPLNLWTIPRLSVLAQHIQKMDIFYEINLARHLDSIEQQENLSRAAAQCDKVASLSFKFHLEDLLVLRIFFQFPKYGLKELCINAPRSNLSQTDLQTIQKSVENLRAIKIIVGSIEDTSRLYEIFHKCKNLESVYIQIEKPVENDTAIDYCVDILQISVQIKALKEIRLILDVLHIESKVFREEISPLVRYFRLKSNANIEVCRKLTFT